MTKHAFTYDMWLALSPEEQIAILRTWNPYAGENRHIPREAGRRFMHSSSLPIVKVRVGIYHMGEYILNPELRSKDMPLAPPWLQQEFHGFRIGFCEHKPWIIWPADEDD